ncbi:hypothetical protein LCM20_10340 [Halobacillus litoralis]|uniref:hypothetical protein n=1 Tax=Halobacillus litoralis TaxID=45668 RepID=UPI001CD7341C|nr:hypothetical protein [Halobacillus litoralis]MCA0970990.1 hypothetical protein [Halobacillus litoralis]
MKQRLIALGIVITIIGIGVFSFWSFLDAQQFEENTERTIESEAYTLSGDGLRFAKIDEKEKGWTAATDIVRSYDVYITNDKAGVLTVTERTLANEAELIFAEWNNPTQGAAKVQIELATRPHSRTSVQSFDTLDIEREHDGTYGVDPTTQPEGIVRLFQEKELVQSYYVGKSYRSEVLTSGDSVLRRFLDEYEQAGLTLGLVSRGEDVAESWALTDDVLMRNPAELESWSEYVQQNYLMSQKWLTPAGAYVKLPWSIEPGTKMGYGRNVGLIRNEEALERYRRTEEPLFEALVLNSVTMAEAYQDEKGTELWPTEYTSTWLKKPYGVTAPYVDTRHNEKLGLFLREAAEVFDLPEVKELNVGYAEYLVKQMAEGNTIEVGEHQLISDYPGIEGKKKPHTSLNHALGEAYYLLSVYEQTGREEFLETAYEIRQAIEAIGTDWIRDNGDLWYQVNEDLTFSGNDYPRLTYVDLVMNQNAWSRTEYGRSDVFAELLDSKKEYMER